MMKPLRVTDPKQVQTTYACIHWRNFPARFAGHSMTPEELRAQGVMSEVEYQTWHVWERECAVLRMEEGKCLECPHIRRLEVQPHQVPKLYTLDGKTWTPAVDMPSIASLGGRRPDLDRDKAGRQRAAERAQEIQAAREE